MGEQIKKVTLNPCVRSHSGTKHNSNQHSTPTGPLLPLWKTAGTVERLKRCCRLLSMAVDVAISSAFGTAS